MVMKTGFERKLLKGLETVFVIVCVAFTGTHVQELQDWLVEITSHLPF